jgi:hypothetical protein
MGVVAIQEHAYYGSFGYHVTNFFRVSLGFGGFLGVIGGVLGAGSEDCVVNLFG